MEKDSVVYFSAVTHCGNKLAADVKGRLARTGGN